MEPVKIGGSRTPASAILQVRTTIGEGRQRGIAGAANRIEVLSDQPFDVCPGLRDAAENLTAAGFRFGIASEPQTDVLRPRGSL